MANSNRGKGRSSRRSTPRGRERSRKRRPAPGAAVVEPPRPTDSPKAVKTRARGRGGGGGGGFRDPLSVGERPQSPWHPWPLSEMLILIGAVGAVVGFARLGHGGISNGGPVLFAGLGAVALGTIEITWREHNAGYRSHTLILALLPVVVFHSVLVLVLVALTTVPRLLNVGLLAVDAAIFAVLFKLLRVRFLDARARVVSRL